MQPYSTLIYFAVALATLGILLALFFRFNNAESDMESRITGIWSNEENTMRILIYSLESRFQGKVIWTKNIDTRILGAGIIHNMNLGYFSGGEGLYVCPFTKAQFNFRMKLKQSGLLHFQLFDGACRLKPKKVEAWKQVK